MLTSPATLTASARRAVMRGTAHLLDAQQADGRWEGIVRSDPGVAAQFLLAARYVERLDPAVEVPMLAHLDRTQLVGGGWAAYPGGPQSLDVSLLCYTALRFGGRSPSSESMRRAQRPIIAAGGMEAVGFVPRFPLVFWDQIPLYGLTYLSPKVFFLPAWIHPNLFDLGIFQQAVLAVELLLKQRAVREPPAGQTLDELRTGRRFPRATMTGAGRMISAASRWVDGLVPARRLDLRAADWLALQQNSDGMWAGMALFTTRVIMALHATDPVRYRRHVETGLAGLQRLQVGDGAARWQQLGSSPVLDTAITLAALLDAGFRPDASEPVRAFAWLLEARAADGGWSFAAENARRPDTDSTLHVLEVLARAPRSLTGLDGVLEEGIRWLLTMQDRSGGWTMWSNRLRPGGAIVRELEINGAVDISTPDVTARAVRALARLRNRSRNRRKIDLAIARGCTYLKQAQRRDGSWPGRWAVNYGYGTAQGVTALAAAGDKGGGIARARRFLLDIQQNDGGWGESPASDGAGQFVPASSTATQTALVMLGLLADRSASEHPLTRAAEFLLERQRDGRWDDETFCQTMLPERLYFQNSLLAHSLALAAVGTWLQ